MAIPQLQPHDHEYTEELDRIERAGVRVVRDRLAKAEGVLGQCWKLLEIERRDRRIVEGALLASIALNLVQGTSQLRAAASAAVGAAWWVLSWGPWAAGAVAGWLA